MNLDILILFDIIISGFYLSFYTKRSLLNIKNYFIRMAIKRPILCKNLGRNSRTGHRTFINSTPMLLVRCYLSCLRQGFVTITTIIIRIDGVPTTFYEKSEVLFFVCLVRGHIHVKFITV